MLMIMRKYAKFALIGLLILGLFCSGAMGAPSISTPSPDSDPSTTTGDTQAFSVNVNETCNVTWLINGSNVAINTSVTFAEYSNTTAPEGVYNVTAFAENANGTDQEEWIWTVTNPVPIVTLYDPSSSSVSSNTGDSETFTATVNQSANVTWILDGITLHTNTSVVTASYYNSSAQFGMHNLTVFVENVNGTDSKKWDWNVSNAPEPTITLSNPPSSSVSSNTGDSETFTATVNQSANVTWILNGVTLHTNTSVVTASYYNSSAQIGMHNLTVFAENVNGTDQKKWDWNVTNVSLSITSNPTSPVDSIEGVSQEFNVTANQDCDIEWRINGVTLFTNTSVSTASYVNTTSSVGSYNITAIATNANGTEQKTWTWDVRSKTYYTGDRIWDALTSPSLIYTWTAKSYSGFYYDLDSGMGSESMEIKLTSGSRTVGSGNLKYTTTPINTDFERTAWGSYQVIGFMAENYFAGYTLANTSFADENVNLISSGQMSKVLINEEKSRSVYAGSALILEDGYTLNVVEVDRNGDKVFVTLTKDGSELDSTILSSKSTYVYEKDLGSADDVPIVAVYFDNIFQGAETSAVFVKGIFQISDEYITVKNGDSYGKMDIISTSGKIEMENDNSFTLSRGNTIDIMGKIKFLVADSGTIRFAPFVDMTAPGTYELRGTVAENEKYKWTPLNFEGFYYNMDDGEGTESLEVESLSGTTIPADKLVYKAIPTSVSFEYGTWKTYDVVGFMAENYFAGYPSTTTFADSTVSMISNGQLSKVLINEDKSRAIHSGSGLILDEGYVLNIIEVDRDGNKVAVSLSKDGSEIGDMSIVTAGDTYVYEKDLGSSDDVPIIAVHFDTIFQGAETSAVFVDGIFQISDQYITVEDGDTYGKMKVTSTSGEIVMKNDDSISLTRGKSISIMGDILFKVADSSTVRYYPYVEISTAPLDSLDISMPTSVKQGDYVSIIVTSRGATVSDAAVKFDDDNVGSTSTEGTISYKPALSGTYTVTVEKDGYVSASGQVEVISPLDETKKMSIEVSPDVVYEGNQLIISTIKAIGGEAIEDVDVSYDGKSLGTTSADGTLSYTVKEPGMHKLTATKTGLLDAELNLEVLALEAKFEFSNLVITPLEVKMGKDVTITFDASNTGKAAGEYNVDLMINGNLTESRQIALNVSESTTIEFTVAKDEPGTYLVEANGLSGTFEVLEKSGGVALYVLGILGVFAAVAVGYMFTAGGWTVEMVSTKVAEFIESIR